MNCYHNCSPNSMNCYHRSGICAWTSPPSSLCWCSSVVFDPVSGQVSAATEMSVHGIATIPWLWFQKRKQELFMDGVCGFDAADKAGFIAVGIEQCIALFVVIAVLISCAWRWLNGLYQAALMLRIMIISCCYHAIIQQPLLLLCLMLLLLILLLLLFLSTGLKAVSIIHNIYTHKHHHCWALLWTISQYLFQPLSTVKHPYYCIINQLLFSSLPMLCQCMGVAAGGPFCAKKSSGWTGYHPKQVS